MLLNTIKNSLIPGIAVILSLYGAIFLATPVQVNALASNIVINEVKPSSIGGVARWIELYNPTSTSTDISGWRVVRNNVSGTFGSVIPAGTILQPGAFHTISSTTHSMPQASNGNAVQLWSGPKSTGSLVDSIDYSSLIAPGSSYARIIDGNEDWHVTSNPTKNSSNSQVVPPTAAAQSTVATTQNLFANTFTTWTYHDAAQPNCMLAANPNGLPRHAVVANPESIEADTGAVKLTTLENDEIGVASLQYSGTKIVDIAQIGFSVHTNTPSQVSAHLDIDFNKEGFAGWYEQIGWQGRLVYTPSGIPTNAWSNQEAVASNGLWSWSQFEANGSVWPDGNTSNLRTWNEIIQAFPTATVSGINSFAFGSLYLRAKGENVTYYDNIYLATATKNIKYNFEL